MQKTCLASRKDGKPCGGRALVSGYCFAHDVELQQARQDGAARGGRGKATVKRAMRRMPEDVRGVLDLLMASLEEVYAGSLDPRAATAMSSLGSTIARLVEVHSLEARLEELEARGGPDAG